MKGSEIEIGGWYWFFNAWHGYVVMGQAKDHFIEGGGAETAERILFHKIVNTDGSYARLSPTDETSVVPSDIIKKVG